MQINVKDKVRRKDIASLFLQIWYKCYFFSSIQPGALDCKKFGEKKDQGIPNLINSYLT